MAELAEDLAPTEADRLDQAEALVRAYCGWHIAPSRTETVTFNADIYGSALMLPSMYVTAIEGLVQDGTTLLVIGDDYSWSQNGVLTRYYWPVLGYEVEFTHGYTDPPAEVAAVVQAIAQRAVDNPSGALTSRTIGPFSESYGSLATGTALSLLDSEKAVLDRYRIPPRP